ncbi:glycosyltransferase WbuB [Chryseobacterium glaciei]|uniref:Glycosyltransferase WbuB n=1 Tax=Chryseobacterium glaciei TaxID=1685010 RepID=A0A172Y1N0_9FLAO|nr:glycosyltransferase family 4 protein [Chryseobacterium glaciei]ANF53158.1 glycosyltransferase WbuB [Chryseobacterium glaciei]
MNILFLTFTKIDDINERGIYSDLARIFKKKGHHITIVCPVERREKSKTQFIKKESYSLLRVWGFNYRNTNILEKTLGFFATEYQYYHSVKKHLKATKFDLIFYSTPPITFLKTINYIKKRDNAFTYLLLKDIFPQNAVDLKYIKKNSLMYHIFREKEKKLYDVSDMIGCMSQANMDYILENNTSIKKSKLEINPNSIEPLHINISDDRKIEIRQKYKIPEDKMVIVFSGNCGKPQGIDFLLNFIKKNTNTNAFFLIVGDGTEFKKIKNWHTQSKLLNVLILNKLQKKEFDELLSACDVGLILLSKDFTIPNFPQRLLSYLEMHLPVIAATDTATDVGNIIEEANCGYKINFGDSEAFQQKIEYLYNNSETFHEMKKNSWKLLNDKYLVNVSYQAIIKHIESKM